MSVLQDKILDLQRELVATSITYWSKHVVFTWQWWLNMATLVLPVILWWLLVDKKRLKDILIYGFIVSTFAVFLDTVGETLVLWDYPYLIIPLDYLLLDTDYSILPVAFMLAYQYFPSWKGFIIANTVISAVFSFAAEPLLVWMGFYEIHGWKYIYSFPIYIAIAIISKWMVNFVIKEQESANDL